MKQVIRGSLFLLSVLALFRANLCAQNFVYTNDNPAAPNTVHGYAVADDGSLTSLGPPVPTGGTGEGGGFFASGRISISPMGNLLYVANSGSNSVSGFSINTVTGALTPVPGSPFATGGSSGGAGISLAGTPDGQFLTATHGISNNIRVFSINSDGSLIPVGPLVPAGPSGAQPDGTKVTPNGNYLLVDLFNVGPNGSIAVFSIDSDGGLMQVPGSPFPVRTTGPAGNAAGLDVNCASDTVFVGEAAFDTTFVDVLSLAADGTLAPIADSPFHPNLGFNSNVPVLSPDDSTLFVSNQFSDTVTVFTTAPGGTLTPVGAFFAGGGSPTCSGEATNQAGTLLYVAKFTNVISVFRIGDGGVLSFVDNTTVPGVAAIESLTAFPGKTCPGAKARAR